MRLSTTGLLLFAIGLALALLALSLGVGVGMLRQGNAVAVSIVAMVVVFGPPSALVHVVPDRLGGYAAGLMGWSLALMVCFPVYFPEERARAWTAGMGAFGQMFQSRPPPTLGPRLDGLLPSLLGTPPAPNAEPAAPSPVARPRPVPDLPTVTTHADGGDAVVLPYEGTGSSLKVPVDLEGADGKVLEVMMLFDTGASFTSVDRATLRALGVRVPSDAPEVTVRTANGERTTPLVLLDRVWLGGLAIDGVTVGVCDACAHGDEVGLLGLNVSGRFWSRSTKNSRRSTFSPAPPTTARATCATGWSRRLGRPAGTTDASRWRPLSSTMRLGPCTTRWCASTVASPSWPASRRWRREKKRVCGWVCPMAPTAPATRLGWSRRAGKQASPPSTRRDGGDD